MSNTQTTESCGCALHGEPVSYTPETCSCAAAEHATPLPRILNKHTHGTPAGAVYIGRGSPWGNPFVIGRDGTRSEVIARYDAWITTQPHLLARLPELRSRDLLCFCAPRSCHGETLRRLANAPVCEAI